MQRPDIDWEYFFQRMAWRLAACVIALAVLGASYRVHADLSSASGNRQEQLAALEQQRAGLADRLQAREEFEPRFRSLQAAGVIGEAQRLVLTQSLRDVATALGFPYLRYTVGPRHAFQAPYLQSGLQPGLQGQAATVLATSVEVQAGLVHELDLLRLVGGLRQQAPGFFSVAGCSLERVAGRDAALGADKANIAGTCTLRWYSIPLEAPTATVAGVSG